MKKEEHLFIKNTEVSGLDCKTDSLSLLLDLKVLLKEYYTATFTADENGLVVRFNNNQKFIISVNEIK